MYDTTIPFDPTIDNIVQFCSFHLARVTKVCDDEGRHRIFVEAPSLVGEGAENWLGWIETSNLPFGDNDKGDMGINWSFEPGQLVFVGFIGGDPHTLFAIPGPAVQTSDDKDTELTPKEAKSQKDARKKTRVKGFKTPAGHTLLMDDNGKQELLALVDWTGSGYYNVAQGTKEDKEEDPDDFKQPSYPRQGETRGTKTVFAQTSKPVKEITSGTQLTGHLDLNGQGWFQVCKENSGQVALIASKKLGEHGPSIILDAENDTILLTAGTAQLQILGKKGQIKSTYHIIQEPDVIDIEEFIKTNFDALKKVFEKYKDDSNSESSESGTSGNSTVA